MKVVEFYMRSIIIGLIASGFICINQPLFAQQTAQAAPLCCSLTQPLNCEDVQLYLDSAALEARNDKESHVIIIGRLGSVEKSQKLNQTRMKGAEAYLSRRVENKIVIATGERVKGYGRLEVYVYGKLLYVLPYPRNALVDCSF